ncbi:MAG: septum formation initiator family protein [Pseudomonadota bacterium]|nr:septum formation initiator family protein [Pseudomonadota bacterium]
MIRLILLALFLWVQWQIWRPQDGYLKLHNLNKERHILSQKKALLEKQIQHLEDQSNTKKKDKSIEKELREELGMIKDSEKRYYFTQGNNRNVK